MNRNEIVNSLTELPKVDKIKFYKFFGHELTYGIRCLSVQRNNDLKESLDSIGILSELLNQCFNWIYELENKEPWKWFDLEFSEFVNIKLTELPLANDVVEKALESSLEFVTNSINIRCRFCNDLLAKENPQTNSHIPSPEELIKKGRVVIHMFGWFCNNECKDNYEICTGTKF